MRTSKDPMEPLRSWKELLMGDRAFRQKKASRQLRSRQSSPSSILSVGVHVGVGE
jgi:hypothetical protein